MPAQRRIALGLLFATYAVAKFSTPDQTRYLIPGYNIDATFGDYVHVLIRNSLVLALHALACVAGFMAGSSLPLSASKRTGLDRWVHEKAGPLAIGFVVCATSSRSAPRRTSSAARPRRSRLRSAPRRAS